MKVLVVSKKTNLELHGESIRKRVQAGLIDVDHFKRLEITHEEHYRTLEELCKLLTQFRVEYTTIARGLYWPELSPFSAVITVGGDGTIFEASHHITDQNITLIGIRSAVSSIGKLCHCDAKSLRSFVQKLTESRLDTVRATRLQAEILSAESGLTTVTEPVLNDFLYTNSYPAATTRYKITFAKHTEEQRSSGIWVSTPCGSTAAIHAAGAQPLSLESRLFQYLVRELYDTQEAKSSQPNREGLFDPDRDGLQLVNLSDKAMLACDGLHGFVTLNFGDHIRFQRAQDLILARPDFY
jgi:NAD+ kinase